MTQDTQYGERFKAGSRHYDFAAANALVLAVGATTAATGIIPAGEYRVISTTACWINEGNESGSTPTAAAATAGNMYVPANVELFIQFNGASKLGAIRAAADGTLSLVKTD